MKRRAGEGPWTRLPSTPLRASRAGKVRPYGQALERDVEGARHAVPLRKKQAVRERAVEARGALPAAERRRKSAAIGRRLGRLVAFRDARTVFAYCSMRSEAQTEQIIRAAWKAGKRVALPVSVKRGRRLVFRVVRDLEGDLVPGMMKILEPKPSCPPVKPGEADCIIVPGIAFDRRGYRLGYGAGFYDRFLRQVPQAPRIGLAFEAQLVRRVPDDDHDERVDFIVTERRAIRCRPSG